MTGTARRAARSAAGGTAAPTTTAAPAPAPAPVEPPAWLDDDAATVWRETISELPAGTVSAADRDEFAAYIMAILQFRESCRVIAGSGLLIAGGFADELVPNPAVPLRNQASADMARWRKYFDATPTERARATRNQPAAPDQPADTGRRYPHLVEQ